MHRMNCLIVERYICSNGVDIYSYRTTVHDSQCTYLNIGLLVAPREYVLHGLVLGIY
jgi:hypothetical protein